MYLIKIDIWMNEASYRVMTHSILFFFFFFFFFLLANFKIAYIDKDTIIITDITHITNNPNIYTSHNKITNAKVQ